MMQNGVNIFFCILIPVLLFAYLHQRRQIQKMNEVIEEIQQGEIYQRFRVQPIDRAMGRLSCNLNVILDQLQMTVERAQYFEETWKQMISNLSRDLNLPVTSMLSYAKILMSDQSLTIQERQEFVRLIELKGEHLLERLEKFRELAQSIEDDNTVGKAQE